MRLWSGSFLWYNGNTMETIDLTGLAPAVAAKVHPMISEIAAMHAPNIHSVHIAGSAVLPDYDEKLSNVNSVVVLHAMDLKFVEFLAPLGKKYGKQKIAAPLLMTPEYIRTSLDSFPVEFLDLKLIHKTVYGSDLLQDLQIKNADLRIQCEREVKTKLIHLRQGYLSSLGEKKQLSAVLVRSFTGSMALFRAIIALLGKEPPVPRKDVIQLFCSSTATRTGLFDALLSLKAGTLKPSEPELRSLFELYYEALESAGRTIDALSA